MNGLSMNQIRQCYSQQDRPSCAHSSRSTHIHSSGSNPRRLCRFDAPSGVRVALVVIVTALGFFSPVSRAAESSLAVINAGVSSSEDAPFVSAGYRFLPGDYLYFTFEIAGFAVQAKKEGESKQISLEYQVTPQDNDGRDLAEPVSEKVQTELSAEDKNWVPKRRASFLLPSFLAAGPFRVHVAVRDLFAKAQASRDFPFSVGGIAIQPAANITVEDFRFLRNQNDTEPLGVPAYGPGDTVFARFEMTGFRNGTGNEHHVAYGVKVLGPEGKAFIQDPDAADLQAGSFYPAQFIPGNIALKMDKNNPHGEYVVVLTVRDLIAHQQFELKQAFSIE
jgi:hypothetical protein